jgi:hypothetical protein
MSKPNIAQSRRIEKTLRAWGWNRRTGLRCRFWSLAYARHPWWDWGHRVMILVGSDFGGNWDSPKPPTWWYVAAPHGRMRRTGYPRRRYEVVKNYEAMRARMKGLNEDQSYEWRAIGVSQDGDLHLGRQYWGGTFYGLDYAELPILLRWLIRWQLANWFGLRSWLYSQALHAAVYCKKPGSCAQPPPKGGGGYSHWLCQLKRNHDGLHRFNNMVWGEVGGETLPVAHVPIEALQAEGTPS